MYIACKGVEVRGGLGGPKRKHDKACFYFLGGNHIYATMLGNAPCSKNIGDGPNLILFPYPINPNNIWPKMPPLCPKVLCPCQ
jgi:hypothetical protein